MKFIKWTEMLILTASLVLGFASFSNAADETAGEKVKEAVGDVQKGAKKAWRGAKDEACPMVNGKIECAAKKVKNKTNNVVDEVKDKVDAE